MENTEKLLTRRKEEYRNILVNDILPYWLGKTDEENGGFYTCYNVFGDRLVSRDKYVWSQGRCTWLYSKLAMDEKISMPREMREKCRQLAIKGAAFLEKCCILPDGKTAFVLDENNQARVIEPYQSRSISSFADCFVAMGLAVEGMLEGSPERVKRAYGMFLQAAELLDAGEFKTAPDILPDGWRSQAPYMIMINTSCEIAEALRTFGLEAEAEKAREICRAAIETELGYFYKGGVLLECLDREFQELDTVYGRHINPGHTQECMWFIVHAAGWAGMEDAGKTALEIIKRMNRMAWDEQYGGMYYYMDRDGGAPKGRRLEAEQELAEAAVRDWANKMWWPQLETIYANLLGWYEYRDETCLEEYRRYHEYTFRTFPNPDPEVGEWIQIRSREGEPVAEEVGGRLPVKDPYHLIRTLMILIDLITEKEEERQK